MVQVLPYVPSFGEKLMPVLSESIGNIAKGYQQQRANQNDQKILEGLAKNPNATPLEQIAAVNQLSKDKRESLTPLFTQYIKTQQKQGETSAKAAEAQKERQEFEPTLNRLDDLVHRTGAKLPFSDAFFGGIPGTAANQEREEFDSLGFLAADKVFTHFNKGTISKDKLKKIVEDLAPKSDLTQSKNRARIKALRTISGLPSNVSQEKFDAVVDKATKSVDKGSSGKVQKGTKLTKDVLEKWKTEGLDRNEAEKRAKEQGYEF